MEATDIREKLHEYVNNSDEKLLKLLYALAKEYNDEDDYEYEFSREELEDFEKRRAKRISGESKTYSWKEAREIITGKKNLK
jgi:hypothetical protein